MSRIESWGRLWAPPHQLVPLTDIENAHAIIKNTSGLGLPFGNGRSYGDSCLNTEGTLWQTRALDRLVSFNEENGQLTCEAGVLLADIQRLFIPRGWMLPVTPGTQLITVGGAIANDVHGKNHHRSGSFCNHVRNLVLARTTDDLIHCGPDHNREWFTATAGGMGLTGVVLEATLQLKAVDGPWLSTESIPYYSLDDFFALADESEESWEHTVSWIDCTSRGGIRGIFMRGNHCIRRDCPRTNTDQLCFPFTPPVSCVNRVSLPLLNNFYFYTQAKSSGKRIEHYQPFFYPLDRIKSWNKAYGRSGFYQYQSVIPTEHRKQATLEMLREIERSGQGSMLSVLKTFGAKRSLGMMSFPMEGVTLALDFPNKGHATLALFDRLDAIVSDAGGRLYPAKDARMPRALFEKGYPNLEAFTKYRDPGISSSLSRRLTGR